MFFWVALRKKQVLVTTAKADIATPPPHTCMSSEVSRASSGTSRTPQAPASCFTGRLIVPGDGYSTWQSAELHLCPLDGRLVQEPFGKVKSI